MNRREQFDSANIVSWKCILQVCDGIVAGVVDAPGPPSTRGAVRRYGWQGHGEPGVAEGEGRLGAWNACPLAEEPIVRLILDGTVVRVWLDRKATSISLLVVLGVREDGQKVLLALKNMGGETTEVWRAGGFCHSVFPCRHDHVKEPNGQSGADLHRLCLRGDE